MNAKKALCAVLLLTILPFFVMVVLFLASPGKKGDTIIESQPTFQVTVNNGMLSESENSVKFTVPKKGTYFFQVDYVTEEPGFYTGLIVKDQSGNKVFYFGAFSITGFTNQVELPEGECTLELHYFTNEKDLRDFNALYPLFDDIDEFIDVIDFPSFTKTGTWDANLSLTVYEMVGAPVSMALLTLAFGIVITILLFALAAKDKATPEDDTKETLSHIGILYALFSIGVVICQLLMSVLAGAISPELLTSMGTNFQFLEIIIPVDVIGLTLLALQLNKLPKVTPEKHSLGLGRFLLCLLMMAGLTGAGGVLGTLVNNLVTLPFGVSNSVAIGEMVFYSDWPMRILTVGILAPICEELIFRKFMIDRLMRHGEFIAIFTSGLFFGLFHGNFMQFFFTAFIGMLFAFIYLRTGKVIYTILLHMIMNLSTSIITVLLAQKTAEVNPTGATDMATLRSIMAENPDATLIFTLNTIWTIFLYSAVFIGLVIFIVFFASKKFRLLRQENELTNRQALSALFRNAYVWIYIVSGLGLFIISYLPKFLA
jgi:membrane protease YdiL (CAAX protease family)